MAHQHGNKPDINQRFSARQWYFAATHVAGAACGSVAPFLAVPGTTGELAYGGHHALGTLAATLYIGGENPGLGGVYFWTTLGAFAVQSATRVGRTRIVDSRYEGDSIVDLAIRKATGLELDELTVKGVFEPVVLAAAGLIAADYLSPALGVVLGISAASRAFQAAVAVQQRKAEKRSMNDAMAEVARVTGRWPSMGVARAAAGGERPGRVFAKRIIGVCMVIFAWFAWTGQLGYQVEGAKIAVARLLGNWTPPGVGAEAGSAPRAPTLYGDEIRRRVDRRTDREERLRRWRQFNRANGFF